jgi:hypothetical protein
MKICVLLPEYIVEMGLQMGGTEVTAAAVETVACTGGMSIMAEMDTAEKLNIYTRTPLMIDPKMNEKPIKELEKKVEKIGKKAMPIAISTTLNNTAWETRKDVNEGLSDDFIVRNKYTERGNLVEKNKTLNIDQMRASVGSTRDYMEKQHDGFVEKEPFIPMDSARTSNNREKRISKRNYTSLISIANKTLDPGNIHNERQKRVRLVQHSINTGVRTFYASINGKKGIYKVVGGRKGVRRGWPKGAKIKLLYYDHDPAIHVDEQPWLMPRAINVVKNKQPKLYRDALIYQLNRIK